MRLNTKVRYAVTAMLDLAIHSDNGPIVLADISERQQISLSYLEQIFAKLKQAGLVKSLRGPGGGYRLNRNMRQIFIAEIIDAVNETFDATRCHGAANCQHGQKCLTHHLWCDLSEQIHDFLSEISLAGLMNHGEVKTTAMRQDEEQRIARALISQKTCQIADTVDFK